MYSVCDPCKVRPVYILLLPIPDSKIRGTNMGSIGGLQVPGGPHVSPMNFAIWDNIVSAYAVSASLLQYYKPTNRQPMLSLVKTMLASWMLSIFTKQLKC